MSSLYFVNIAINFCVSIFSAQTLVELLSICFFVKNCQRNHHRIVKEQKETGGQPNWKKQNYEDF